MIALAFLPDDFSWWQLVMTIIPIIGTIFALVRALQGVLRRRASHKWDRSYTDIQSIYQTIQELLSNTPANRVLVVKSENGGGIPTPDGDVTNTVIHEVCGSDTDPIQKDWVGIKLDRIYSGVITKVSTLGVADVAFRDLEAGEFRDLFTKGECHQARLMRICATGSALLYICICLGKDATLDSDDRLRLRAAARRLCKIFAHHHQLIKREARE